MGNRKISNKRIKDAIEQASGMVYVAARLVPCSPNTIKARIQAFPELAEIQEAEDGFITDTAELKLKEAILNGEPWAVKYRLTMRAKDRGYVERQEIGGPDGSPIVFRLSLSDDGSDES